MDAGVTSYRRILFLACATLAVIEAMAAQEEPADASPSPREEPRPVASVTLEGFVLAPDGSPAESAVVVSSAGGKALTDVSGNYRLEIEVPIAATSVQVTAVGSAGRNLAASASVAVSAAGATRVDPLVLALGASCSPNWLPTFGGRPGTLGSTLALTVYDDGGGPALYAGGEFFSAGGVAANRIARWDGSSWSALGSGVGGTSDVRVNALAAYDDGSGAALFAGGTFSTAGGVGVSRIAKWDGSSWTGLGSGMSGGSAFSDVLALTVFDDGGGPALYAGGYFTTAGGVAANRIAKWDGASWTALGGGMSGQQGCCPVSVFALTVHDDGSGPALYAGGNFTTAGGVTVNHIARWDGTSWTPLGSGMSGQPQQFGLPISVRALTVYDDGSGPALYAGGNFTTAGGVAANHIARWDGSSWSSLGSGMNSHVHSLTVYDDGGGSALHAGGSFSIAGAAAARQIAKWDGSSWSPLGSGMFGEVRALTVYDDGGGSALFPGGNFTTAGGLAANNIARWKGSSWTALGSGMDNAVAALTVHDDGSGPALHAGGSFTTAGGVAVNRIAKWDGSSWSPLGSGLGGDVRALAVYDDGSGPALYAGGDLVGKWNGSTWESLRMGLIGDVHALAVYDDGSGPTLVAGGSFTWTGGYLVVNNVASWDGERWRKLGSGMNSRVTALAVHDDGSGPALYAGGLFTIAGGGTANRIAKWNGSSWTEPGSGMNDEVQALAVYDDGSGPALYAGGKFTVVSGGFAASHVAKWDGTRWRALGSGTDFWVQALAAHDDGSGPALYVGGRFDSAGGVAAHRIARWNGSLWSALDGGLTAQVRALAVHDDGGGPALFAGGDFVLGDDSYLAKWGCPDSVPPVLSCPPPLYVPDRLLDGQEVVHFTVTATDSIDPAPVVVCTPPSGSTFPLGTTLVDCTATDASGNQSTCQFQVTVSLKARPR